MQAPSLASCPSCPQPFEQVAEPPQPPVNLVCLSVPPALIRWSVRREGGEGGGRGWEGRNTDAHGLQLPPTVPSGLPVTKVLAARRRARGDATGVPGLPCLRRRRTLALALDCDWPKTLQGRGVGFCDVIVVVCDGDVDVLVVVVSVVFDVTRDDVLGGATSGLVLTFRLAPLRASVLEPNLGMEDKMLF